MRIAFFSVLFFLIGFFLAGGLLTYLYYVAPLMTPQAQIVSPLLKQSRIYPSATPTLAPTPTDLPPFIPTDTPDGSTIQ